jgi:hypothetical protein
MALVYLHLPRRAGAVELRADHARKNFCTTSINPCGLSSVT